MIYLLEIFIFRRERILKRIWLSKEPTKEQIITAFLQVATKHLSQYKIVDTEICEDLNAASFYVENENGYLKQGIALQYRVTPGPIENPKLEEFFTHKDAEIRNLAKRYKEGLK